MAMGTGHVSAVGPAHAVAYHGEQGVAEQPPADESILVVGPHASRVRFTENVQGHGLLSYVLPSVPPGGSPLRKTP